MPHPVFPHSLDHLIVQSPSANLEAIHHIGKEYLLKTCALLREKNTNYAEFLDWISLEEPDIIPYEIQVTMCLNIWAEGKGGSTKTLRALFLVPSIQDRIVTRCRRHLRYYRKISHYLNELNKLVISAYPDIIPVC